MILNPTYNKYRAGRIEIYDERYDDYFAKHEIAVRMPKELWGDFVKVFEGKKVDAIPWFSQHYGELTKDE
jgi:hypothetical protein